MISAWQLRAGMLNPVRVTTRQVQDWCGGAGGRERSPTRRTPTGWQAATARIPVELRPRGIQISPDGRWVYVTAETSNTVSVIDTRTNDVVASFLVDDESVIVGAGQL
jgi:YVTN family beta-propeller protein